MRTLFRYTANSFEFQSARSVRGAMQHGRGPDDRRRVSIRAPREGRDCRIVTLWHSAGWNRDPAIPAFGHGDA